MTKFAVSKVVTCGAQGVRLTVRAKPGLSKQRDIKIVDIGNDKCAVEVSVQAEAKEGKANQALIERLADALDVAKRDISIVTGETGRIKVVEVFGAPEALRKRLEILLS